MNGPLKIVSLAFMQKGQIVQFLLIGLVTIVVMGVGVFYFWKTQTPRSESQSEVTPRIAQPTTILTPSSSPVPVDFQESVTWKTYSISGSYEFKYPLEKYSIRSTNISNDKLLYPGVITIVPNDSFNEQSPMAVTYKIDIAIADGKNLSMKDPLQLFGINTVFINYDPVAMGLGSTSKIREISLGGVKAYRLDNCCGGQAGVEAHILAIKDNKLYEIYITPFQVSGDLNINKKYYEQIIKSFSFLK